MEYFEQRLRDEGVITDQGFDLRRYLKVVDATQSLTDILTTLERRYVQWEIMRKG